MRLIIYLGLFIVFAVGVVLKIQDIRKERAVPVVSILSEWRDNGVPVEVFTVREDVLIDREKLTGSMISSSEIEAMISRSQARRIREGARVTVQGEDASIESNYKGRVTQVSRSPVSATGLYRLRVRLDQPINDPGKVVFELDVEAERLPKTLIVPTTAVVRKENQSRVWRVSESKAELVEVKPGRTVGEYVQILSGVQAGDQVVARGQANIAEELGIRVIGTYGRSE